MKRLLLLITICISYVSFGQTNKSSISFDGIDDAVVIGEHAIHEINDNISILSAFKFNSSISSNNDNIIISREGNYEIGLNGSTMQLKWAIANANPGWTWTSNGMNLKADKWYWLGFTYADGEVKIYINGNLQATETATGKIGDFDNGVYNELWIGDRQGGNINKNHALDGSVDELHIWNVVLTNQQIRDYMNCPPVGNEKGLIGYWNFEEGTGTTADDITSNEKDGRLTNGPTWSADVPVYNNCIRCTPDPIKTQPTDQIVNMGNDATFTFTDSLTAATYQWQMDVGTGYTNLSNAGQFSGTDTKTLTVSAVTMSNNNTKYRCLVTESSSCSDTTDVANLTVSSCTPDPIKTQPTDQTVNMGVDATFDFSDSLTAATYQWQMDAGTGYTNLSDAGQFSGTKTKTLTVSAVTVSNNNTNYRCLVTESSSCMDTTDVANLTVMGNLGIEEANKDIQVSPNPSTGLFSVQIKSKAKYEIYNINGQLVAKGQTRGIVDLTKLPSGYYQLILISSKGLTYSKKIQKL